MPVIRFSMSGREFRLDTDQPTSMFEVLALRQVGIDVDQLGQAFRAGARIDTVMVCGLAYLAALREDPTLDYGMFARSMVPDTVRVEEVLDPVPIPPPADPSPVVEARAQRRAAAKQAPKTSS